MIRIDLVRIGGITLIAVLIFLLACTKEKIIVETQSGTYKVSGAIYSWRCGIHDRINNPRGGHRTGSRATATFLSLSGLRYTQNMDDSSEFSLRLDEGPYVVIAETPYTYPDTFWNIYVPRDSILQLDVVINFVTIDSVRFQFYYANVDDSLGFYQEMKLLTKLNSSVDYPFEMLIYSMRRHESIYAPYHSEEIDYYFPLNAAHPNLKLWMAYEALKVKLEDGHIIGDFPTYLTLRGRDIFCLDK